MEPDYCYIEISVNQCYVKSYSILPLSPISPSQSPPDRSRSRSRSPISTSDRRTYSDAMNAAHWHAASSPRGCKVSFSRPSSGSARETSKNRSVPRPVALTPTTLPKIDFLLASPSYPNCPLPSTTTTDGRLFPERPSRVTAIRVPCRRPGRTSTAMSIESLATSFLTTRLCMVERS